MMRNKNWLHVMWRRAKLRLYKLLNKTSSVPIGMEERYAIIIVLKLLSDSDNELLLHPSLNKFYIKSDINKIFLVCSSSPNEIFLVCDPLANESELVSRVECRNVKLGERAHAKIYSSFVAEVEKRRQAMEREYTSNIQFSLMRVANNIKSNKVKKR